MLISKYDRKPFAIYNSRTAWRYINDIMMAINRMQNMVFREIAIDFAWNNYKQASKVSQVRVASNVQSSISINLHNVVSKVCVLIAKEATGPLLSYMIMSWFEDFAICGCIWNGAHFVQIEIKTFLDE